MFVEKGGTILSLKYLFTWNACTWEADSRRPDHEIPCFAHTMHAVSWSGSGDLSSELDPKWMCLNCKLIKTYAQLEFFTWWRA